MFRVTPYPYQLAEHQAHGGDRLRALWWEPGLGKTCVTLASAGQMFEAGEITGLLVLAPSGVHEQWIRDAVPEHLAVEARVWAWHSQKASGKRYGLDFVDFLRSGGPRVMAMSYDSIMTDLGAKAARAFLDSGRCMYVLDESPRIKTPGAKITKRVLASAKYAAHRRILTGTPVDDKPFDVYAQIKFLDERAWQKFGASTFGGFKTYFGVWDQRHLSSGHSFPELVAYRNMAQLKEVVLEYGSRLLKKDVLPDLPDKMYQKIYFQLSPTQKRVYKELGEDLETYLEDGARVTAALAITRQVRQQQITSGYLPADDERNLRPLEESNPRVRCLLDLVDRLTGQVVIWGKYDIDVDTVASALRKQGYSVVTCDGRTPHDERHQTVQEFHEGRAQYFVGKPAVAGEGIDGLQVASTMVYYNNGFRLRHRLQSEDRLHRIGQKNAVLIIDILASETVDEYILQALREKRDLAAMVQGDEHTEWA